MSRPIIEVEALSKCYRLGAIGASTLRAEVSSLWDRLRGRDGKPAANEFWALRDVSFTVQPGEVVGIIGRNGAGKSTLLKLLSRITTPTSGRAVLRGRVASLLEVGTGFHPDLTGRENIFLNGAILGMTRAEIRRKFDEIVAFAEIERFIDTPVKRYSSGMYVRLAFAVAAHLEPEILIVDEVLAVGDIAFQKKCLGKMQDVAKGQGRTVLFVSHNLAAVRQLCQHGVVLDKGQVRLVGPVEDALAAYLRDLNVALPAGGGNLALRADRGGDGRHRLRSVALLDTNDEARSRFAVGEGMRLRFHFDHPVPSPHLVCAFYDEEGRLIADFDTAALASPPGPPSLPGGLECTIASLSLKPGRYRINIALLTSSDLHDWIEAAVTFEVEPGLCDGLRITDRYRGTIVLPHKWNPVLSD